MMESSKHSRGSGQGLFRLIIGVLVFGSIWGFFEATLGGFLNLIIFPNKGAIMGGIGMAVMGCALAIYRKPAMLPGIGIVAASFKWLNAWFLFVPASAVHIINPAMAIFLESLAFGAVAVFMMDRISKNLYAGTGAGVLVGLIAATAYIYFAVYVTHSPIFARLGINSIGEFIIGSGLVQAVFFGVFLPLGYLLGSKMAAKVLSVSVSRPVLYYATSAAVVAVCLGISSLAVVSGL